MWVSGIHPVVSPIKDLEIYGCPESLTLNLYSISKFCGVPYSPPYSPQILWCPIFILHLVVSHIHPYSSLGNSGEAGVSISILIADSGSECLARLKLVGNLPSTPFYCW